MAIPRQSPPQSFAWHLPGPGPLEEMPGMELTAPGLRNTVDGCEIHFAPPFRNPGFC